MQPERLAIYLDENHCNNRHIPAVLQNAGMQLERHLDHFRRGTPDDEWLPLVGQNRWVLLTTDKRIRLRWNERRAVTEHRVRMFYFSRNDIRGQQMGTALEKALPAMLRLCATVAPPFFAAITRAGEVHLREFAPPHPG